MRRGERAVWIEFKLTVRPPRAVTPDLLLPMLPLSGYREGQRACVAYLGHEDAVAERLRTLGVREGACVCVMLNTDKCILAVDGCRLALQREVADQVFATDLAA